MTREQSLEHYCQNGHTQTFNDTDRRDKLTTFDGHLEKIIVFDRFTLKIPDSMQIKILHHNYVLILKISHRLNIVKLAKIVRTAEVGLSRFDHMAFKNAKDLDAQITYLHLHLIYLRMRFD